MDMKPMFPAEGIVLNKDFGNSKFYTVECSCGNSDDQISFEVESNPHGEISVNTWTVQKTSWWDDPFNVSETELDGTFLSDLEYATRSILNSLAHRFKITWQVWTKGYVKYSSTTVMTKQQALNYSATLVKAINDVEYFEKE
jgi:hypothetical protein